MKNSRNRKLLAAGLCVLMIITALSACNNKRIPEVGDETNRIICILPDPEFDYEGDYGGYDFCFLTQSHGNNTDYTEYLVSDGETQDVILDAVYKRNNELKKRFNINITHTKVSDLVTTVRTQVNGGAADFDVILGSAESLATLAREGHLLDLNSVERFEMSKRWWDSNAAEQLSVGGKLYFTNGDMNVQEFGNVIYFNKEIINHLELVSPYDYIEWNEWTLDNWAKLVSEANGMCECGTVDKYGTLYEKKNDLMFLQGAGVHPISHSDSGYFRVTEENVSRAQTVCEKIRGIFESVHSWNMDDMDSADVHGYANKYDYARSLFCQDLFLFHYEGTGIISQFADMESEFGIVPFPKYDETQEDYYSLYPSDGNLIALPGYLSGDELDRTAVIVEGLNYYSNVIVKPAWYDKILQRRYVRDDESEFCLDLIYENRVYDVGLYYGLYDSVKPTNGENIPIDRYEVISDVLQKTIDQFNKKMIGD